MQFVTDSNRHQTMLTSLVELLAPDNPLSLMVAFIDKLDIEKLGFIGIAHKTEGRPPYTPGLLLKLFLYAYLNKIRSSRKLKKMQP